MIKIFKGGRVVDGGGGNSGRCFKWGGGGGGSLTLFKPGFLWLSMTRGGIPPPSRKQCYS